MGRKEQDGNSCLPSRSQGIENCNSENQKISKDVSEQSETH